MGTGLTPMRRSGRRTIPDQQAYWRRVVRVARVVQLRAVADHGEYIHLRAQLDVLSRRRNPVLERQRAVRGDRHVHEEVDVVRDVTLLESAARADERLDEALPAGV